MAWPLTKGVELPTAKRGSWTRTGVQVTSHLSCCCATAWQTHDTPLCVAGHFGFSGESLLYDCF